MIPSQRRPTGRRRQFIGTDSISGILCTIEPGFRERIIFTEGQLKNFDMVIATGSNNSSRYFEQYFGKYPNIIRKNRNSIAIIEGNETEAELEILGSVQDTT